MMKIGRKFGNWEVVGITVSGKNEIVSVTFKRDDDDLLTLKGKELDMFLKRGK